MVTKEDNDNFMNSTKCWICDNDYIDNDVKVRDHCHVTGKYRSSRQSGFNSNLKLNSKIPVVIHKLKHYDSHLFTQELGKFHLKK